MKQNEDEESICHSSCVGESNCVGYQCDMKTFQARVHLSFLILSV